MALTNCQIINIQLPAFEIYKTNLHKCFAYTLGVVAESQSSYYASGATCLVY